MYWKSRSDGNCSSLGLNSFLFVQNDACKMGSEASSTVATVIK